MEIFIHNKNIEYILKDTEFNQHLNQVLTDFYNSQPYCPEAMGGKAITTCSNSSIFFEIDKQQYITEWLKEVVLEYCKTTETHIKSFSIDRSWCNRIYFGVNGKPHDHGKENANRKVVILYYEAPENCSEFICVESKQNISVKNGMAIVHPIDMIHAVSENKTNEQRTAFIFDITLEAA